MSLKAVHVLVILTSILLCFGFGAWAVNDHGHGGSRLELALGIISLGGGALLIVYFKAMLRKLRDISYL